MSKKDVRHAKKQKIVKPRLQYNFTGVVVALFAFMASVLPSLLPRPWLYQGVISGLSIAIGYGIGVLISFIVRWATEAKIPKTKQMANRAWQVLRIVGPIIYIVGLLLGVHWQNQVRTLVQQPTINLLYAVPAGVLALLVSVGVIKLCRFVRKVNQRLTTKLNKYVPRRISIVTGLFITFVVISWIVTGVFSNFFVTVTNNIYSSRNNSTPTGVVQPQSPLRSGSPASLIAWDDVGFQGKGFVGRGPNKEQLQKYSQSTDVKEPIRLYVGLKSADTAVQRANLAVAELKRTGAFDRRVLVIANTTGTGWLEPQAVDSIEYMYGGDTAIVAQQYSYLPSWISFLVDKEKATETGAAFFDAVHAEWATLPENSRPKLITYGLSLGSFSGQAAFAGVNDLRASVDGALFVGTPSDTRLWNAITKNRDEGTPQWLPTYRGGEAVRFAYDNLTIASNQQDWQFPRLLYMQHASDPVVWFSFSLPTSQPDWLKEPRGSDISPKTHWYPFVTFLQVGIDQFFGTTVPNGHGHNYPDSMVDAWAAVVPPANWTEQKAADLRAIIATYSNE